MPFGYIIVVSLSLSYLSVYDLHFSKQDHVHLIKLLYELVIIPNVDAAVLSSSCALLRKLLRYLHVCIELFGIDSFSLSENAVYCHQTISNCNGDHCMI